MKKFKSTAAKLVLVFFIVSVLLANLNVTDVYAATSGDAYINYDGINKIWTMGTDLGEQKVQFANGKFLLKSFYNKSTSREYIENGMISEEFRITVNSSEYTGDSGGYTYDSYTITALPAPSASPSAPGALRLSVVFHNSIFEVTANYEVYPSDAVNSDTKQSLIKKWFVFKNRSGSNAVFSDPYILDLRVMQSRINNLEYAYFEGGGAWRNYSPHWSDLNSTYYNTFDSTEVFPGDIVSWQYNGSQGYFPFYVLHDKGYDEGIYTGFNYLGVWEGQVGNKNGYLFIGSKLQDFSKTVANNETLQTPNCFMGVYKGDLDSVSEQLYDWQYVYKWDYTHDGIGNSAIFSMQLGGNHEEQMYNVANVCRETGSKVVWEDAGWFEDGTTWYEDIGNWIPSSADYGYVSKYAAKIGAGFRIWMPVQHYDDGTTPINENPGWATDPVTNTWANKLFDLGDNSAVNWMRDLILSKKIIWNGAYQWRFDGCMSAPTSTSTYLEQYSNWLRLMKEIKTADSNMVTASCSGGGQYIDWDVLELADDMQLSDTNPEAAYYASQMLVRDKFTAIYGGGYSSMTQVEIDRQRRAINLNNYFDSHGIYGRYSKVYHPQVTGAAQAYDFVQYVSKSREKAIITQWHTPTDTVTIYPKRLNSTANYTVTFHKNTGKQAVTNTGSYWMSNGITISSSDIRADEIILLNVSDCPGRGTDTISPNTPGSTTKKLAGYLGHAGVEIKWSESADNNWMSHYEILRDGNVIGKVAKGTFYFDSNGYNISSTYTVRALDADGNTSSAATASLVSAGNSAVQASLGFSGTQGTNNWTYKEYNGSTYTDMNFDSGNNRWYGTSNYCYIAGNWMHTGDTKDSARVYTAQQSGRIILEGRAYKGDSNGDGVNIKVLRNGVQVWPSSGWQLVYDPTGVAVNTKIDVNAGDTITFLANRNSTVYNDTLFWDPVLAYDRVQYKASIGFSSTQEKNYWSYKQYNGSTYTDMTCDSVNGYWKGTYANCIVAGTWQHPDTYNSARVFSAPMTGDVIISGVINKSQALGDGVSVKIMKNSIQIWPVSGWRSISATSPVEANVAAQVVAGDQIYFIVNQNGTITCDGVVWDPTITYN